MKIAIQIIDLFFKSSQKNIAIVFLFSLSLWIGGYAQVIQSSGPILGYSFDDLGPNPTATICSVPTKSGYIQIENVLQNPGVPIKENERYFFLDCPLTAIKNGTDLNYFNFQAWGTDIYTGTPTDPCKKRIVAEFFPNPNADPRALSSTWINTNDFIGGEGQQGINALGLTIGFFTGFSSPAIGIFTSFSSPGKFYNNSYPVFNPYIIAVYKCSQFSSAKFHADDNEYLGLVHLERVRWNSTCEPKPRIFTIGLAYSRDIGRTWTYCGDIFKPQAQKMDGSQDEKLLYNIGGSAYVINKTNDSMYLYFNEFQTGIDNSFVSVASAKLEEVLVDAQNLTVNPMSWQKYCNGAWNSGGASCAFDGLGSNLFQPPIVPTINSQNKAVYCKAIKKYLLLMVGWFSGNDLGPQLRLYVSKDGISWPNYQILDKANVSPDGSLPPGSIQYASFSAPITDPDAAPDFHEVGKDFYIHYQKLPNGKILGINPDKTVNVDYRSQLGNIYYQRISATTDLSPVIDLLLGD